jgi:hypothetical protein
LLPPIKGHDAEANAYTAAAECYFHGWLVSKEESNMSTDNINPSNKDATISSTDDLVKTTKSGDVEMTEEELKRVSGGTPPKSDTPTEHISLNYGTVKIEY